jgi:hypothetical protein
MGKSESRRREESSHPNAPAAEALAPEQPDMNAPPPPPTRKQKLLLAGMVVVMAAWLAFLGLLVRK